MGDWSMLNYDLLAQIASKLDTIKDCVYFDYFSAVCRSWNHASSLVKRDWKPSMPCLLLAENRKQNPNFIRNFFSLDNDRCHQLSLPQTYGSRCWGSACGWVVTFDGRQIHMLNPITKARFELPPPATLLNDDPPSENLDDDDISEDDINGLRCFIRKAIVLKSVEKGHDDEFIVFVTHEYWVRSLAFARPGDQTWTAIVSPWPFVFPWPNYPTQYDPHPFNHRIMDIVCRDRSILILYEDGSTGYLDISDLSKSENLENSVVKAKEYLPSPKALKDRYIGTKPLVEMYLAESFGSLLFILRNKEYTRDDEPEYYKTDLFEVFRYNTETKNWEQVKELGDVALFVGNSQTISIRASDCRNCKSNCIYFTDDCDEGWRSAAELGGHDMGVYNLENGAIHIFYEGDDMHSDICTPFWFVPQFQFQKILWEY